MGEIKIIENFLSDSEFIKIKELFFSNMFPWFYNDMVVSNHQCEDLDNFQLIHNFYKEGMVWSNHFEDIFPIVKKINPLSLLRVKANLLPRTSTNIEHGMHVDYQDNKVTTAVFYINTNNGYTIFENGKRVTSKENTLAIFPSQIKHSGATCTNEKSRIVVNFNYIELS